MSPNGMAPVLGTGITGVRFSPFRLNNKILAPVAQRIGAPDYGLGGCRFESCLGYETGGCWFESSSPC